MVVIASRALFRWSNLQGRRKLAYATNKAQRFVEPDEATKGYATVAATPRPPKATPRPKAASRLRMPSISPFWAPLATPRPVVTPRPNVTPRHKPGAAPAGPPDCPARSPVSDWILHRRALCMTNWFRVSEEGSLALPDLSEKPELPTPPPSPPSPVGRLWQGLSRPSPDEEGTPRMQLPYRAGPLLIGSEARPPNIQPLPRPSTHHKRPARHPSLARPAHVPDAGMRAAPHDLSDGRHAWLQRRLRRPICVVGGRHRFRPVVPPCWAFVNW